MTLSSTWGLDVCNRLENYICHLPVPDLHHLESLSEFPPLAQQARRRLSIATIKELDECVFFSFHKLIVEKYIQNYLASKNYAEANTLGKQLKGFASGISEAQQRRIIVGIDANNQVRDSIFAGPLILELRNTGKIERGEFDTLLRSCGLKKFIPRTGEDAAE